MKFEKGFLINEKLVEMSAKELLSTRSVDKAAFLKARAALTGEVPLVAADPLVAGMPYASSRDGTSQFYLPRYALKSHDGRRTLRLEMFPASDDPTADAGRLTVEVQRLPMAGDDPLRVMKHEIALRLGYRLPVSGGEVPAPFSLTDFDGIWSNADADTRGILMLEIRSTGDGRIKVHATQNTLPEPASLGTAIALVENGTASVMFRRDDLTVALTLSVRDRRLFVTELTDIHDPNSTKDFIERHIFLRDVDEDRPTIWMELAPVAKVDSTTFRSVTAVPDMETYLRLYAALTRHEYAGRIEVIAQAKVGRRSMRQVFVGTKNKAALLQKTGSKSFEIDKKTADILKEKAIGRTVVDPGFLVQPGATLEVERPAQPARLTATPAPGTAGRIVFGADALAVQPGFGGRPPLARDHARDLARRIAEARRAAAEAERKRAEAERKRAEAERKRAEAERLNILLREAVIGDVSKVKFPPWVMVEDSGKPVLTRRTAECIQTIAPLAVDAELFADLLDAPEDTAGVVLLRHEVHADGHSATFYRDGIQPAQVYYEPEEFRLARADAAPHAPSMLFHLTEEPAASDDAEPGYSVTMTYQLRPYIRPALIAAAKAEFGSDVTIAPIVPSASALTIRLASVAGDEITRTGVDIDFADGLSDAITFGEDEFRQLTAGFQTVSGVGLTGEVDVTFPDGRSGQVPVRVGVRDTLGALFNARFVPPEDGQGAVVRFTNRIESPVRINTFPPVVSAGGGVVPATDAPPAEPVAPGAGIDAHYGDGASGGAVPVLADASAEPDMMAILAQTMVVQGYASDEFDVTVSVDPLFFEMTPAGVEPLTGVEVTFRTRDEPVILTELEPSQTVRLPMPVLLFLTNASEAQHYSYSVRDLHASGPGAATAFRAGSADLDVEPAMVTLAEGGA